MGLLNYSCALSDMAAGINGVQTGPGGDKRWDGCLCRMYEPIDLWGWLVVLDDIAVMMECWGGNALGEVFDILHHVLITCIVEQDIELAVNAGSAFWRGKKRTIAGLNSSQVRDSISSTETETEH